MLRHFSDFIAAIDRPKETLTNKNIAMANIQKFINENNASILNLTHTTSESALHIALRRRNYMVADWLLAKPGIDVNARDADGHTPFMITAQNGSSHGLDLLVNHSETELDARDAHGNTALMHAVLANKISFLNAILSKTDFLGAHKIDVHAQNDEGNNALVLAAANGHVDCFEKLTEKTSIDVNVKNKVGLTAFMAAAMNGQLKIINFMSSAFEGQSVIADTFTNPIKINESNYNGDTALMLAAQTKHTLTVKRLLEIPGLELDKRNKQNQNALSIALHNELYDNAQYILLKCMQSNLISALEPININILDLTKLYRAILSDKEKLVEELIENENTILKTLFLNEQNPSSKACLEIINNDYQTILRQRLLQINTENLTTSDLVNIKRAVNCNALESSTRGSTWLEPKIAKMVVFWLSTLPTIELNTENTAYLKRFKKALVAAIETMPKAEQQYYFNMIFDDKAPDFRKQGTALSELFWAGHVDINDTSTNLGKARVAHQRAHGVEVPTNSFANFFSVRIPRGIERAFSTNNTKKDFVDLSPKK